MPALARWPGKIAAGTESMALVSTLDVVPTVLSIIGGTRLESQSDLDGMDISPVLFNSAKEYNSEERVLFFWRDGFSTGQLPQPFGRFDVVAVKVGRIKAWFSTKSAHYNNDTDVWHEPPLLFDTIADPAEGNPLNPQHYTELIGHIKQETREHKASIDWTFPLALDRDPKFIPCANRENGCRIDEKYNIADMA